MCNKRETEIPIVSEETKEPKYMEDAEGRLIPIHLVKPVDRMSTEVCRTAVAEAMVLQEQMRAFKLRMYEVISTLIECAANDYGVSLGGKLGNVSIVSLDGRTKIQLSIAKSLEFGAQIKAAKELIDQCVTEWTEGSRDEVRTLIQDAFRTDASGDLSTSRILSLRRLQIADERWLRAMTAIADSLVVRGSKSYVRIYQRSSAEAAWQVIALDLAAL